MVDYQIILCEDYYDGTSYKEREICEIGSSSSNFSGKAISPEFYTKIDGTHELSFDLPRYCFNEETGEQEDNELIGLITNKSKIILIKPEKDNPKKEYHFVVNTRTDKDDDSIFSYSYHCTDAYIEELSKTGYGLSFSDDVEGGEGLGTIHELAEKILKDSGWEYDKEKTGPLLEYSTDLEYNINQQRYDTIYKPVPVHPIQYIPELKRYCNKLDLYIMRDGHWRDVYCYEDTEQVVSSVAKNLLYNADDFVDITGWNTFHHLDTDGDGQLNITAGALVSVDKFDEAESTKYGLKMTGQSDFYLLNDTAADANKYISANQPYLFKYNGKNNTNLPIRGIYITDKNPLTVAGNAPGAGYWIGEGFEANKYYVIKPKVSFSKPYIYLAITGADSVNGIVLKDIEFFEAKGKTEADNLTVLSTLIDGQNYTFDQLRNLNVIMLEKDSSISAYTQPKTMYFYRKGWGHGAEDYRIDGVDETVEYLDFEKEINTETREEIITGEKVIYYGDLNQDGKVLINDARALLSYVEQGYLDPTYNLTYADMNKDGKIDMEDVILLGNTVSGSLSPVEAARIPIVTTISLPAIYDVNGVPLKPLPVLTVNSLPGIGQKDTIYKLSSDGKYYQYYSLTRNGVTGGAWDLAWYGDGTSDKRRTLIAEKSNRFNLLQELSELFKVWCVFDVERNRDTGEIKKKVYFKENAINQNFAGFHKGVNLQSIERKADSEGIVTKMYVEDVENEFADNGFVTIRTASLNPWGENYYYNFKYYVDQKLLRGDVVEKDLKDLYDYVQVRNKSIFSLNDQIASANVELNNLSSLLKSITYSISAMNERKASLGADLEKYKYEMSETDRQQISDNLSTYNTQLGKFTNERDITQDEYNNLKAQLDNWNATIEEKQKEKKQKINEFEKKYIHYIKEGIWSDSSYVDNDTYYIDSQKVSNTSAVPATTWTIGVIDGSVLKDLEDFKFAVGDQTILVDNEFFGVEKNYAENYVFEVLISGIKENLEDGTKNQIEVRNYLTSFEDIFQRISAAAQTLELNEQTYDKAAYFTKDGTVDENILQNTLLQNALTLANASDNSYVLNETGLSLQSLINPAKKMRAVADGIFFANSNGEDGQPQWKTGITADGINASMLTTGEINTSLIKIFSDGQPSFSWNKLGITSYKVDTTPEGKLIVDNNSFTRLDSFGFYQIDGVEGFQTNNNGDPWFKGDARENVLDKIQDKATFSLTERGFRLNVKDGNGYIQLGHGKVDKDNKVPYGLYIADKEGETAVKLQNNGDNFIAGWHLEKDRLWSNSGKAVTKTYEDGTSEHFKEGSFYNPGQGFYLSNRQKDYWAIQIGPQNADFSDVGGDNNKGKYYRHFLVDANGELWAKGAHISGNIAATSGKIGGWSIGENYIHHTSGKDDGSESTTVGIIAGGYSTTDAEGKWRATDAFVVTKKVKSENGTETTTYPFVVRKDGKLFAEEATIRGTIEAKSGRFYDDIKIGTNENSVSLDVGTLKAFFNSATGGDQGNTYITNIYAGGGSVGGWKISSEAVRSPQAISGTVKYTTTGTDLRYATGWIFTALMAGGVFYVVKEKASFDSSTIAIINIGMGTISLGGPGTT